jgi:hypothetical protein
MLCGVPAGCARRGQVVDQKPMLAAIVIIPLAAALLWLLSIRPYCRRHGNGFTPGASFGVTFWVDWQEATELSAAKGDRGMMMICRLVLWLHFIALAWVGGAILFQAFAAS